MKCISCSVEINPQWSHAININVCPFCGQHIMEEELKTLFSILKDTMDKLSQYPDQLNDWMLSNHSYIKTDSPDIKQILSKKTGEDSVEGKKFIVKVKKDDGTEEEVVAEKLQSEEKTNQFFKRAGAIKSNEGFESTAEKTQHIKKMVDKIKRDGSGEGGITLAAALLSTENDDPEEVEEISADSIFNGGLGDAGEEIPASVLRMANLAKNKSNSNNSYELQRMEDKARISRENFENGNNRGGRGGGFSRSG